MSNIIRAAMNAAKRFGLSACLDEYGQPRLITMSGKTSQALDDFLSVVHHNDVTAAWKELTDHNNWPGGSVCYSAKADKAIKKGLL